jgi:hypothetical protein
VSRRYIPTCLSLALVLVSTVTPCARSEDTLPAEPAKPTDAATKQDVLPGPLLDKRKLLYAQIQEEGKAGVGISGYTRAFDFIEQLVRDGQPEATIAARVDSLERSIAEQKRNRTHWQSNIDIFQADRLFGRAIGAEFRRKYGGVPSDAVIEREFAMPDFKTRIHQAYLKSMQTSNGGTLKGVDLDDANALFNKNWGKQIPYVKGQLRVLRSQGLRAK